MIIYGGAPPSYAEREGLYVGWQEAVLTDNVPLLCEAMYGDTACPLDQVPIDIPLTFTREAAGD